MRNEDIQQTELFRAIVGALKAAINNHGPVTPEFIGSAAKRIYGAIEGKDCFNLEVSGLFKESIDTPGADLS